MTMETSEPSNTSSNGQPAKTPKASKHKKPSKSPLRVLRRDRQVANAAAACAVGFGGFLLWAGLAPLAEGVTVAGAIVVEDNRKVVQHLEGGIIKRLSVVDGDDVRMGDVVVQLDDLRSRAQRDEVAQNLVALLASIDRLNAVLSGRSEIEFSDFTDYDIHPETLAEIIARQESLAEQQLASLDAEVAVLQSRERALKDSVKAKARQIEIVELSVDIAKEELDLKRTMLADKLVRIDEIQRLERDHAALQSEASRLTATKQEAAARAVETAEQIRQTRAEFDERISEELVETRTRILSAREKFNAAQDVLDRTVIHAPQSGVVMNMKFFTVGGVVGPGEPIMEIVPESANLIAQVRIKPVDRDAVFKGLKVKARLSAYKTWLAPRLDGEVLGVSADLKIAPETGAAYYEARIGLDPNDLTEASGIETLPGMPVEAFIDSGVRRTFIDYLFEPITGVIRRGI